MSSHGECRKPNSCDNRNKQGREFGSMKPPTENTVEDYVYYLGSENKPWTMRQWQNFLLSISINITITEIALLSHCTICDWRSWQCANQSSSAVQRKTMQQRDSKINSSKWSSRPTMIAIAYKQILRNQIKGKPISFWFQGAWKVWRTKLSQERIMKEKFRTTLLSCWKQLNSTCSATKKICIICLLWQMYLLPSSTWKSTKEKVFKIIQEDISLKGHAWIPPCRAYFLD